MSRATPGSPPDRATSSGGGSGPHRHRPVVVDDESLVAGSGNPRQHVGLRCRDLIGAVAGGDRRDDQRSRRAPCRRRRWRRRARGRHQRPRRSRSRTLCPATVSTLAISRRRRLVPGVGHVDATLPAARPRPARRSAASPPAEPLAVAQSARSKASADMRAAIAQPRMLATTSVSRAAMSTGAAIPLDRRASQLIGIQCRPTHFGDRIGCVHDPVSDRRAVVPDQLRRFPPWLMLADSPRTARKLSTGLIRRDIHPT